MLCMLELRGSGGMLPPEKLMLKYCNLETFPHKIPVDITATVCVNEKVLTIIGNSKACGSTV